MPSILPALARKIDAKLEIECITLDQKPKLIRECGRSAASLRAQGCKRVVIVFRSLRRGGHQPNRWTRSFQVAQ